MFSNLFFTIDSELPKDWRTLSCSHICMNNAVKQLPFQYLFHALTGDHVSVDGIASGVRASAVGAADRARGPR